MSKPPAVARPDDGDPAGFVAWCGATSDLVAFRDAVRRVTAERWPEIQALLLEELNRGETSGGAAAGLAADRDRRGRAAARVLKLDLLKQEVGSRSVREAEAARRAARASPTPPAP